MLRVMSLLNTDATAATTAPSARDQLAESIYPPAPPAPKATSPNAEVTAVRKADAVQGRGFYSDVSCLGPSTVRELTQAAAPAGSAELLARQDTEMAAALVDIGFNQEDTAQLAAYARQFKTNPPTTEQRAEFHREACQALRERYGAEFDTVLKDAKALSVRDHRFAAFLEVSALGDSPWLIQKMAELGRTARAKGRLK